MKSSDISQTVIILVVFVGLHLFNILSVGIKNIRDNWPVYRCNPTVMPFASVFGQDAGSNFTYCIRNMQSDYMSYLLKPVNYNIDIIGSMGKEIGTAVNSTRAFISNLRSMVSDIVGNIFGVFLNILIQFQKMLLGLKDVVGKITGTMSTLVWILEGSIMTGESGWAGPPGQVTRAICFHPDTLLQLKNKHYVKMKNIELGSVLKNGAIVRSVMRISNIGDDGKIIENLYRMRDGENENKILVTGSHLVFDPIDQRYKHVHELVGHVEKTDIVCREFSCLITSNHTIPVGKWLFHDWEDNNGSQSKAI